MGHGIEDEAYEAGVGSVLRAALSVYKAGNKTITPACWMYVEWLFCML